MWPFRLGMLVLSCCRRLHQKGLPHDEAARGEILVLGVACDTIPNAWAAGRSDVRAGDGPWGPAFGPNPASITHTHVGGPETESGGKVPKDSGRRIHMRRSSWGVEAIDTC